jgi:MoaA/NifB/PqqE/SkfB family radical SAM enzyme
MDGPVMSQNVYATNKLAWHPAALEALRRGEPTAPLMVQLMPTAVCNQACEFCSYGSGPESVRAKVKNPPKSAWKNQTDYDTRASLSREKMIESIACFQRMGVKCVEVTGGGEPTVYAHFDELVEEIDRAGLEFAMVTNGTRITAARAARMGQLPFVWVRVSIDAGTAEDYVRTRNVPAGHWDRAWEAVALFAAESRKPHAHPDSTVGVGFVIDRDNWRGVYDACVLAKANGAHNIRISSSFTPDGIGRFAAECFQSVPEQVARAKAELEDATFHINDLSGERWQNIIVGRQTYPLCAFKEVGCVLGPDGIAYSCCSLSFNPLGRMFSIEHQTFERGWYGDGWAWRQAHDPRQGCKIQCLYYERNMEALRLMGDHGHAAEIADQPPPPHANYI